MDNKDFILNPDDIFNIVSALEVHAAFERHNAITDNRDFDRRIQSTLTYMRDFENIFKRSEARYVKLSYSI